MRFYAFVLCIFFEIFLQSNTYCQIVDCHNLGFEDGTTNGWLLSHGLITEANAKAVYSSESLVFNSDEKNDIVITSLSDGNDPMVTAEALPMVAPGSNHSIRIGYIAKGGRYDKIKTSFIVDSENSLFQFKFAVVLHDDNRNHQKYQKPGFEINIYKDTGGILPCSKFDVQLPTDGTLTGFKTTPGNQDGEFQYKNWTVGAIDLKNYIGQKITIEVSAHGCTRERHFGYAYFDAQCIKAEIKQITRCPDKQGFMYLKAPDGFGFYNWSTGNNEQYAKVKVQVGDNVKVTMLPHNSLETTCELSLNYIIPYAKLDTIVNYTICENDKVFIDDEPFSTTGQYIRTINRFNVCDSTVTLNLKVSKIGRYSFSKKICEGQIVKVGDSTYTKTGNYTTIIKRVANCDSIIKTNLLVDKKININSNIDYKIINRGDSVELITNINPADNLSIVWKPTDGVGCKNCITTWIKPLISTAYTISVANPNQTCFDTDSLYIKVEPCQLHAPDVFTPNSDNINGRFYVLGGGCIQIVKSIAIYNRWGELMFAANNFPPSDPNYGWDGTYLGKVLEADVYAYQVIYQLKEGTIMELKHAVTLVR